MAISIKCTEEIKKMRVSGQLAAKVLEIIKPYVKPGISTGELDQICHEYITKKQHAISGCLGYHGFPKSVCISVNEVVCHGIPDYNSILKDGDIVNIDVTLIKNEYYADTSKMFFVGKPNLLGKRLCEITKKSLYLALHLIKPGIRLEVIGKSIQKYIETTGFSIVREYCGHGIGKVFHEEPQILHYDADDKGIILETGMSFTIEPMINAGSNKIYTMQDGWTVKTRDNNLSAQYEHTVVVTNNGCEILTLRNEESIPSILINEK